MYDAPLRRQFDAFLDDHRQILLECLDGLTEEQAAPSPGALAHHAAQPAQARDVRRAGLVRRGGDRPARAPRSASRSRRTSPSTSTTRHRRVGAAGLPGRPASDSRRAIAPLGSTTCCTGNRRGPLPLRWVMLHMLREHAQHCGHAEILREQVLAADA